MSFYNNNDIQLDSKLDEIKQCMEEALELINVCNNDTTSEFNTCSLEKDIKRFLEDY